MASACVSEELPASASTVWSLIEDFGDLGAWAPKALVTHIEGTGKGATREVNTEAGIYKERCEAHDPAARSFSYRLLESPHGFTDYVAVVTLGVLEGDRCSIEWKGTFERPGIADADIAALVEGTYRDGFIASLRATILNRR